MSVNKDFPPQNQQEQPKVVTLFVVVEYSPQRKIRAAAYDSCKRLFQIGVFVDNEHYSNLQALLIQLNPAQSDSMFQVYCILPTIKSELKKIQDKLSQIKYQIVEGKLPSDNIHGALQFLLKKQLNHYVKEMENKEPLVALSGLLNNLKLQRDQSNKKQYELTLLNLENYMKLDKSVINALNLFPKQMEKKILTGSGTIYQILNRCKSQIGTRCLKRWMKQPLQQVQSIEQRLDYIQFFIDNPAIKTIIQNQLKKLPDLDALYYTYYKVQAGKKANAQVTDLLKIYRVVRSLEELLEGLQNKRTQSKLANKIIQDISRNVGVIGKVCQMIEKNIVMEGRDSQFYVKPTAQANLAAIAKEKQKVEKQLNQQFDQVRDDLNTDIQKVVSTTHKYVMEASKKVIDKIKSRSHYKFLTAKQSKITFTTDKLGKIINSLKILQDQYKKQQAEILKKMFNIVAGYYPIMEQLSSILSQLDVYTAFASMVSSSQQEWCRPRFGKNLKGISMYHPCVKNCIPNNIQLEDNKTIVLTGPNMGGKSTYIRTVGVCVFLAHIGCFVPATHFQTPMIDAIITRVGASDMQIKGISTFMSEMLQSSCMLNIATSKSLVLIDQLGRGTSTSQGFGLAWGICQYLHKRIGSYCLFATHFHQMTSMADEIKGVINMHTSCKIDSDQIHLQYKVLQGKMEKSYGIEVARMVGFPEKVIETAQVYLNLYENTQQKQNQINPEITQKYTTIQDFQKKKLLTAYQQMHRKLRNLSVDEQKEFIKKQYKTKMINILSES